jgi:hypothetical protein
MLIPKGQLFVAKQMISNVVKSGAKNLSFSIFFGHGSKGIIDSEFLTKA